MIIKPDGSAPFLSFQPQVSLLLVMSQERRLSDTFWGVCGLSSDVVL